MVYLLTNPVKKGREKKVVPSVTSNRNPRLAVQPWSVPVDQLPLCKMRCFMHNCSFFFLI